MSPDTCNARGFTLIELMIVVGVIGLLTAIAYPAYQSYVLRTHRAVAAACLQELAMQMERRYTVSLAYDQPSASLPGAGCVTSASERYDFGFGSVTPAPASSPANAPASGTAAPTASTYLLQAIPKGAQAADTPCGTLRLDHQGQRTRSGSAPDVQSCWR